MAVTHADLEPSRGKTCLSRKTGVFLIVLTILLGLSSFILCLLAESTRSQVTWLRTSENENGEKLECVYSGSGKMPLLCATCAFLALALAMVVEHAYMLIAVSKSSPAFLKLDPDSASAKSLTKQAAFFFISTWICFAVGEILLLAGVSVESGHLRNWSKPRDSCHVIGRGLFSAAGVFALTTVSLASGLCLTALRALRMCREVENVTSHVLETSAFHAHAPASVPSPHPHIGITTLAMEKPHNQRDSIICISNSFQ